MSSTHTADAAGGEAIYSSDGLAPLPIPIPPPSATSSYRRSNNNNKNNDDDDGDTNDFIDNESPNIIQSFEVFAGKVFRNHHQSRNSLGRQNNNNNETKLETLARIQMELQALEEEQKLELFKNNDNGNNVDHDNETDDKEEDEIMKVVNDLSSRLKILQNASVNQNVTARQQSLTSYLQNLKIANDTAAVESTTETAALNSSSSDGAGKGLSAEQRLFRIEQFLGGQIYNNASEPSSILERLEQAERTLNSIDEKALNQAASRAKVIRADLEAAAKARSKISNINIEDAAIITKLHDQLVDMDGFLSSNILSTIVNRLSSCAGLHTQSMEFGSSLKALEDMVKDAEVMLKNVDESVKLVESGMVENMKIIQKNMEHFDQK